jgi:hypothetical protein
MQKTLPDEVWKRESYESLRIYTKSNGFFLTTHVTHLRYKIEEIQVVERLRLRTNVVREQKPLAMTIGAYRELTSQNCVS